MSERSDIYTIEDWDQGYFRRLTLFVSLSAILHVLFFGGFLVFSLLMTGGKGLDVMKFDPGSGMASNPAMLPVSDTDAPERVKIFRVDFFSKIIPWTPPPPEPEEEVAEEVITPVEDIEPEEPEPSVEEIVEEPAPVSAVETEPVLDDNAMREFTEVNPDEAAEGSFRAGFNVPEPILAQPDISGLDLSDDKAPDALGLYGVGAESRDPGNVYPLPDWELPDKDNLLWKSEYFLNNYTIYIIGDISTRHGLEDLLAWNYVLRQLITNPQAAWPPNVVTVASSLEGYYQYDKDDISELLESKSTDENTFGVQIVDPDGDFPLMMGYTKLPQPVVVFVDGNGYIRLIMIGRIKDISNANIQATMDVISDMWQWDEEEAQLLPTAITLLINLLRDTAYDEETRKMPPEESAYTVAPTWGYPENYEEFVEEAPKELDPSYYYAPF